jgi:hypothetical protein
MQFNARKTGLGGLLDALQQRELCPQKAQIS